MAIRRYSKRNGMTTNLYDEFAWRGMVYDATEGLQDVLAKERVTAYIGFDPTASSLHVGSLLPVMALARLQRFGHAPLAIVGGGTGMIGDPSGKSQERTLLSGEQIEENLSGIRKQLERFLDFEPREGATTAARVVNNADWLEKLIGSTSSTTTAAESAHHDVLGFCRHGPDPEDAGRGHIFSLYVAPAASGRGLGSYLLAHALADLERRHLDPVTIWVFEQNERARRLYTGFGFFPDATRRVEAEYGAEEIRLCRLGERAT